MLYIFTSIVTNNRGYTSTENIFTLCVNSEKAIHFNRILRDINEDFSSNEEIRLFEFEHVRYVFEYRTEQFVRILNLDETLTTNQLIKFPYEGVSDTQRDAL